MGATGIRPFWWTSKNGTIGISPKFQGITFTLAKPSKATKLR